MMRRYVAPGGTVNSCETRCQPASGAGNFRLPPWPVVLFDAPRKHMFTELGDEPSFVFSHALRRYVRPVEKAASSTSTFWDTCTAVSAFVDSRRMEHAPSCTVSRSA